jgi:hypothetical protein
MMHWALQASIIMRLIEEGPNGMSMIPFLTALLIRRVALLSRKNDTALFFMLVTFHLQKQSA